MHAEFIKIFLWQFTEQSINICDTYNNNYIIMICDASICDIYIYDTYYICEKYETFICDIYDTSICDIAM